MVNTAIRNVEGAKVRQRATRQMEQPEFLRRGGKHSQLYVSTEEFVGQMISLVLGCACKGVMKWKRTIAAVSPFRLIPTVPTYCRTEGNRS